jgi:cob(I)alamin adenosyltransferase
MIQFIKGPWRSGEDDFVLLHKLDPEKFQVKKMGKGFVGILGDSLPREEHVSAAREALAYFREEVKKNTWGLIVLDEINVATSLGLLTVEEVLDAVKDYPEEKLLIMSGRGAPQEYIDRADLATEMRELKHPYNDGRIAKLGIEF